MVLVRLINLRQMMVYAHQVTDRKDEGMEAPVIGLSIITFMRVILAHLTYAGAKQPPLTELMHSNFNVRISFWVQKGFNLRQSDRIDKKILQFASFRVPLFRTMPRTLIYREELVEQYRV